MWEHVNCNTGMPAVNKQIHISMEKAKNDTVRTSSIILEDFFSQTVLSYCGQKDDT